MSAVNTSRRTSLHVGLAATLAFTALAGCQNPGAAPQATTPEAMPVDSGTQGYQVQATSTLLPTGVTVSHNSGTASRVIDGNTNSCWDSGFNANPTMTLTLAEAAALSELRLKINPNVGTYTVEVSGDGTTWTTALTNQKNTSWNVETKKLPAGTVGKFLRLRFANGGKKIMAFEAQLRGGAAPATATPAPVPTSAPSGTAGATASHTNGTFVAGRAIDGDTNKEWQSGNVSNPTLTVDRGASATLTALNIKTNPNVGTYAVEVSEDGSTFRQVLTNQKNTTWNVETKALPAGTTGRFLRLKFANGGKNVMVFEVTAATSGAVPAPVPTTAPTAAPTTAPSWQPPASSGTTIFVNTGNVLHKSTSHVLGTNRNHVTGDFPNGAAKLAKLKEIQPRWGGGKYLYRIGHGPTDGRNDYSYMTGFHFEQAWNQTKAYPYDDIREGLKEANTLGADQMHVINFGTSNADEAARYVSYLNKAGDANRAKYPFAQQNVRLFEIGNEIAWSMVRGHSTYAPNETAYAKRAKEFAIKMRAASDVPIKIGANGSINSNWEGNGWSGGATTVKNIMQTMGDQVDFLLYHGYPSWPLYKSGDLLTLMAQNEWNKNKLEKEIKPAIRQYANGRDVYVANTEFFTHLYNDVTRSRGMFGALYSADTLNLAFNQDIRTAVQFAFEHKDMADASFFINNDPNNTTAIFKFQKMLAEHWGDNIVQSTGQEIPSVNVAGASTSLTLPRLAFSAATTGSKTFVMVINRTEHGDIKSNVNVGFTPSSVTAYQLKGDSGWQSANGTVSTIANANLNGFNFPKASVTIFEVIR